MIYSFVNEHGHAILEHQHGYAILEHRHGHAILEHILTERHS